jgi:peptide/nickel transport system substrate-binding protein
LQTAEEIGIKVQVDITQKSLLLEETASRRLYFSGAAGLVTIRRGKLPEVFYSENPAPPNYTRYRNPQFDCCTKS